jgi:drug/metabolite transporter (DMT)-like permease
LGPCCIAAESFDTSALSAPLPHRSALDWLNNQPYLLLSLTSLFWAGNIVLARDVAGHVPPWPFARTHLRQDWSVLLARWPLMLVLSATGFAINNALSYWGLQYTQALNALLI